MHYGMGIGMGAGMGVGMGSGMMVMPGYGEFGYTPPMGFGGMHMFAPGGPLFHAHDSGSPSFRMSRQHSGPPPNHVVTTGENLQGFSVIGK